MRELPGLLPHGREPARVPVAERVDGDARGEVEVRVPVCVPEGGPLTLDEDDVWPGVGLEDVAAMRRGQVGEGRRRRREVERGGRG